MMAASSTRMRLTVEVLPLEAKNARGPHQATALAAFQKSRKFALPVDSEHTIEQVWQQIDDRYKTNYLSKLEASCFEIKKLQDAYSCDLDVGDTIGAIFEGENDPQMRSIKVVPSFVNRDFSMPPTTNLRPGGKQKRMRETSEDRTSKRRRFENEQHELIDLDLACDEPIVSNESEHSNGDDLERPSLGPATNGERPSRSKSGSSLELVQNAQTGNEEFTIEIKEESPELGVFKKPAIPRRRPTSTPRRQVDGSQTPPSAGRNQDNEGIAARTGVEDDDTLVALGSNPGFSTQDSADAAIRESPKSSPERHDAVSQESGKQGLLREESEAPFMKQSSKAARRISYSRAQNALHTPSHALKGAGLLNNFRSQSTGDRGKVEPSASVPAPRYQLQPPNTVSTYNMIENVTKDPQSATSRPPSSSAGKLTRPSFKSGHMNTPRAAHTPKQKFGLLTNNLGVEMSSKKKMGLNTPRARAESNDRSRGSSYSVSDHVHTPSARPGTADSRQEHRRFASPKIVIPVRSPAGQAHTASDALEAYPSSAEPPATNRVSPQAALSTPVESRKSKKDEAASPAAGHPAKQPSSRARRTPIPPPPVSRDVAKTPAVQLSQQFSGSQRTSVPPLTLSRHVAQTTAGQPTKKPSSAPRRTPIPLPPLSRPVAQILHPAKHQLSRSRRTPVSHSTLSTNVGQTATSHSMETSTSMRSPDYQKPVSSSATKSQLSAQRGVTPRLSNGKLRKSSPGPSPEHTDCFAIPTSGFPTGQPSASRHSQSPHTGSLEMRRDESQSTPALKSVSPALSKRPTRYQKDAGPRAASAVDVAPGSQIFAKQKSATESAGKGGTDDAIVLSSRASSSHYSDFDDDRSRTPVTQDKETPKLSKKSQSVDSAGEKMVGHHARVMRKMFPDGQEESRRDRDPVREVFGDKPVAPIARRIDLDPAATDDAELRPDADVEQDAADVAPSQIKIATTDDPLKAPEIMQTGEKPTSNFDIEQTVQEEVAAKSALWNAESWGFGGVNQANGTAENAETPIPRLNSPSRLGSQAIVEYEDDADDEPKSKSTSHENSTRSSPEVSRRPARYLSHSPTPERSTSDDDSDVSLSCSQSRAASAKIASANEDSESDVSSDSSDEDPIKDADTEDEDIEMPDVAKAASPDANASPPSSPPGAPARPVTLIPATQSSQLQDHSQPAPGRTPIPLPRPSITPIIPATQPTTPGLGSSQSISQLAASRRATYSKFPSIKKQLNDARAMSASAQQVTKFDPRTSSLGRLAKKPGKTFSVSDSSSDDETSSESSGEVDIPGRNDGGGGSCSVA